jgi:hypothetical protein
MRMWGKSEPTKEKMVEILEAVHHKLIGFTLLPDEASELLEMLEYEILTHTRNER